MRKKYMISIILMIIVCTIFCCCTYATDDYTWEVSTNVMNSLNNVIASSNNIVTNSNIVDSSLNNTINSSNSQLDNTVMSSNNTANSSKSSNVSAELESTVRANNILNNNSLNLTAGSGILMEQSTGQVLYAHNIHEKLRPASVTKIMSILLVMEQIDSGNLSLTDKISCSQNASDMGGSQIWLDPREELTVNEMLKAVCVVSANDCVMALAEHIAGSEEAFVEMMNNKAKSLGMNDTTFKNCHGIDEDGHLTSAYDIALMSRELLTKHPSITNYTMIYMDSLRDGKSQLVNTNKLVRNYDGCTGLKTGSTSLAKFNLSASATRNGLSLISVIMNAETGAVRFNESKKLLDYGFNNYQYKELAKKDTSVGTCTVNKGLNNQTEAVLKDDFGLVMAKTDTKNIEQNVEIYNNVFAPIKKGQKIGEVTFKSDGNVLGSVDLVSNEDIDKYGLGTMTVKVFTNWFSMLRK